MIPENEGALALLVQPGACQTINETDRMRNKAITSERLPQLLSDCIQKRFWSKIEKLHPDDCWLWKCAVNIDGYAVRTIRSAGGLYQVRAPQLAWVSEHRTMIPDDKQILHNCIGQRRCCNPGHLRVGTQKENVHDTLRQGRWQYSKGEFSATHKLTTPEVIEIRRLYAGGNHTQVALGKMFNVAGAHICLIVHRKQWTHI